MGRRGRTKKVGSTRGFGARYGSNVRKRYVKVLTEMKRGHRCPKCGAGSVRRRSVGVWNCRKCNLTFTGGAYIPVTKLGVVAKRSAKGAPSPEPSEAPVTKEREQPD
ncbi:MAG: 50S ribosomal protein L37ae [Candidatus Bathyarchaeota archaeon]|nr:MAG: 50S ribosomal protein L37ae [Candidatus Bathyarchaeota archaeon]